EGVGAEACDSVILNPVVQYLPGTDYRLGVLEGAPRAVRPGGRVFLGDVRNFRLLAAFHASVQLHKAPATLSRAQLWGRVRSHTSQEEELLVDPAFFAALRQHLPQISRVEVQLKRGQHLNELTRFPYDVALHVGADDGPSAEPAGLDWQDWGLTLPATRRLLEQSGAAGLRLLRVPNARLAAELRALELLTDPRGPAT